MPFDPRAIFDAFQWPWLVEIVLRTLAVYVVLVLLIRAFGKRELGQMSAFDLVVLLTVSNAVQNAMTAGRSSLDGGLISAAALLLANWTLSRLGVLIPGLGRALTGSPTLLVHNGHIIEANLRREGIETDEILMAAREHGIEDMKDVRGAVLEVDGTISVIPIEGEPSHPRRRRRPHKLR